MNPTESQSRAEWEAERSILLWRRRILKRHLRWLRLKDRCLGLLLRVLRQEGA